MATRVWKLMNFDLKIKKKQHSKWNCVESLCSSRIVTKFECDQIFESQIAHNHLSRPSEIENATI